MSETLVYIVEIGTWSISRETFLKEHLPVGFWSAEAAMRCAIKEAKSFAKEFGYTVTSDFYGNDDPYVIGVMKGAGRLLVRTYSVHEITIKGPALTAIAEQGK
jgi:hypothetical protein